MTTRGQVLAPRLAKELAATGRSAVVVTFRPHAGEAESVSPCLPESAA